MKCPHCKAELIENTNKQRLICPRCGYMYLMKVKDDLDLSCKYDYGYTQIKFKEPREVLEKVLEKVCEKLDNHRWEVVGCRIVHDDYSLIHGQGFMAIKRRRK